MQPPPPPLDMKTLKHLVETADIIVVGTVESVQKSQGPAGGDWETVQEVHLHVVRVVKGAVEESTVVIRESYESTDLPGRGAVKDNGPGPEPGVVGLRADPSPYHGTSNPGDCIIVFLR